MALEKFLEEINELKKAKELLDDLLAHYSIYSEEFDNKSIKQDKPISGQRSINQRIRPYKNFDDSE